MSIACHMMLQMVDIIVKLQIFVFLWNCVNVCIISVAVNAETPKIVGKEGHFSGMDDVFILNNDNMKDRVYGNSMAWVVEFYSSWCGHCIHFAPTWKTLAKDLKGWRRVVSVGAMDCSFGENLRVCQQFRIAAYPSIMLIPPNFSGDMTDHHLQTLKTRQKGDIKAAILDFITNPQFPAPPSWPSFRPVRTVKELWDTVQQAHKVVVLVFEEEHSTVGTQVMLDLVDYPDLLVGRMEKGEVTGEVLRRVGVLHFPSVYRLSHHSSLHHLISGTGDPGSDRRRFVDLLLSLSGHLDSEGRHLKGQGQGKLEARGEVRGEGHIDSLNSTDRGSQQGHTHSVYMQDLESTLTYALRQEVTAHHNLHGERLDALKQFVSLLAKYYPGRGPVKRLLVKADVYLGSVDYLTGDAWLSAFNSLQDQDAFLPTDLHWVRCQGSRPGYRGYPCGMWTLFHVLSVSAYQHAQAAGHGAEVVQTLCTYLDHFSACHHCTHTFLAMATNLQAKIRTPADGVLWLWMAHNKVNRRLRGAESEDPRHPKTQFPSAESCPACRPDTLSDDGTVPWWNTAAVLRFMDVPE
ncbi:sulfhydryl oxidase 2-like [Babylonia areolata]|uniref:sulfhydryl oxidase 2-like n=1 Tax=Babylonia areolata TaxID=304850 RepID=UPI003FD5F1B9